MSFFAKLYKSQEAARERNKREKRRSESFKFGTEYMEKCHLTVLERERKLVQQDFERIRNEIENTPRLDFSGNGPLPPRSKHEQFNDDSSMSEDDDGEIPNENEDPNENEASFKDEIDVHDTTLFFRNNPSVLVPILTVNGKDTAYLEEIGLVKKVVEVKEEDEELEELDDKRNNSNNRFGFGRRNFSNIRGFVNNKPNSNIQNTISNTNNQNGVNTKSNSNTQNASDTHKTHKNPISYDPGTGTIIPKVIDPETKQNNQSNLSEADNDNVPNVPNEPKEMFIPFYLRPDYDPSYGNMKTETVKKYAILLRQRTPVGYRRGRYGALERHGHPLDLLTLSRDGMQNARENINARLGGSDGDDSHDRPDGVRPKITKANAPSYQTSDPEMYNADGTLRTCHILPPSDEVWAEAKKANYLRDPKHPVISNKLDIKEIFAKD